MPASTPNSEEGQKRPKEARRGRNSRETTAGASKRKGIRAKPRRERRNAREFARNHSGSVETKVAPHHSGSVETQGNSRETTAEASKREMKVAPHRVRRCGPQPKRASRRGQKRPEQARRGRNARETTAGASKNHSGSVETKVAPHHSGSVETQGNLRKTTAGASKRKGIRAKPRQERRNRAKPQRERRNAREFARNHGRERRNAREFARNHSGSVETKVAPHRVRRCGPQPKRAPRRGQKRPEEAGIRAKPQRERRNAREFARNHGGSVATQRNSRETTAGAWKRRSCPTAACAVAARNQFRYSERKNPSVQALFGEKSISADVGCRSRLTVATCRRWDRKQASKGRTSWRRPAEHNCILYQMPCIALPVFQRKCEGHQGGRHCIADVWPEGGYSVRIRCRSVR